MKHSELRKLICKTVKVGAKLNEKDVELIDIIDTELLKLGTLAHDAIDWKAGRAASQNVLATHKNIKALTFIWNDLLRQATAENLLLVVETVHFVIEKQLKLIHPFEPKFERLKSARLKEIMLATVGKLSTVDFSEDQVSILNNLLDKFKIISPSYGIEADKFQHIEKNQNVQKTSTGNSTGGSSVLDAKGRADLRRDIRLLASKITSHDPDAGVAYFLRSYGAWMELSSLPESDAAGITAMNAMPASIVTEFEKELMSPSLAGLQRLEDRLSNSPDWFDGHFMAAKIAVKLGLVCVSDLIRQRVQYRIVQLPEIQNLRYANGTPFVSHSITDWVSASPQDLHVDNKDPKNNDDGTEMSDDVQTLLEQYEFLHQGNLSIKDKSIQSIKIARNLKELNFFNLSKQVLTEVNSVFSDQTIQEWEPEIYAELKFLMT